MFGLGLPEMMVLIGLMLLFFGPKHLPKLGESLGASIRGFKGALKGPETDRTRKTDESHEVMTRDSAGYHS